MANRDCLLKNFAATSSTTDPDGSIRSLERSFDYVRGRVNTTVQRSASGKVLQRWSHSWRAYTLAEVVRLLERAKLEFTGVFGGWQSEPYGVDAGRMVVISRKHAG